MSTFGKTERESLEDYKFMFPETRSGLIASQKDANLAPSRIGHLNGVRRELAVQRGIRAILLQGFKLPKPWQREVDGMGDKVSFEDLDEGQKRAIQRATLRAVAQLAGSMVEFSEQDEAADAEAARRQAEDYADAINKRRGSFGSRPSGEDASARAAAEKFAQDWNRRHGRRDK